MGFLELHLVILDLVQKTKHLPHVLSLPTVQGDFRAGDFFEF